MSEDRRFGQGPGSTRPGAEGEQPGKSVTSSRARNRTVMLTPEMTGQVRALLYHEDGQGGEAGGEAPSEQRPDPMNDLLSTGGGWSRPERNDAPSQSFQQNQPVSDFGPLPNENSLAAAYGPGGFSSQFEQPQNRPSPFGTPTFQGSLQGNPNLQNSAPFHGSAGQARGLQGVQPPGLDPAAVARRERGGTRRFSMDEPAAPQSEPHGNPAMHVTPQRRMNSGKVIGFLVSFDSDENGECFDIRSGRLLITCRPTDQGDYILIDHPTVSPLHAIIRATKEGKVEVLDQLSEYGTGIIRAGEPAEVEVAGSRTQIQHGDVLRFGERRFVVCLIPAVLASAGKAAPEAHTPERGESAAE